MTDLARLDVSEENDVFTVRHHGRQAARLLGFDQQDQIRIATALSEVSRDVLDPGGGGSIVLAVDRATTSLRVSVTSRLPQLTCVGDGLPAGARGAARLMDGVDIDDARRTVRLVKKLPAGSRADQEKLASVRKQLFASGAGSPLDELRAQNQQLLAALEELRDRQEELSRLNHELEETNRGVMAMYEELSRELEETNRGVVALYAELDDRTAELEQVSRSKSRFLSSISHELRTPINSVNALATLLLDADSEPVTDEQRRQVQLIRSSASSLLQMVNELLDLAKAESGRLEPAPSIVDLCSVLAHLRGTFRPLVRDGVRLDIPEPEQAAKIETDEALLRQVLGNLLSNAVKFTEHGEVSLVSRVQESGQHLEITVADTGIGIPIEEQSRIFEEFYQVRGPLQAGRRGTGLGLAYVKTVMEVLDGTVGLISEPGTGTAVTLTLPLRWSALGASSPASEPVPEDREVCLGSVLVVDDDQSFRQALRGMLQGMVGRVIEARDGHEALDAVRSGPDAVFLDLRLPGVDGVEVLTRMGEDPELRSIPVVIVSSSDLTLPEHARLPAAARISKAAIDRDKVRDVLRRISEGPHR